MENLKDKVFLLKVPSVVYNEMINQKDLGHIDIIPYPNSSNFKNPKIELYLNEKFPAKNFTINYNPTNYFFTFKEKKGKLSKVKKIDYFGSCIAKDDNASDNIVKQLKNEINGKSVSVKRVIGNQKINFDDYDIKNDKKVEKERRTRIDKNELKLKIFNLFSEKNYLTNKEIANQLQQPDSYLKEVLNEICDYISSGANKGCYVLKSDYVGFDK